MVDLDVVRLNLRKRKKGDFSPLFSIQKFGKLREVHVRFLQDFARPRVGKYQMYSRQVSLCGAEFTLIDTIEFTQSCALMVAGHCADLACGVVDERIGVAVARTHKVVEAVVDVVAVGNHSKTLQVCSG